MKNYKNHYELSEGFLSWLIDGRRKFLASCMDEEYCFVKEHILGDVIKVYQVDDPTSPQEKLFAGFCLRPANTFYHTNDRRLKSAVLVAIGHVELQTARNSLYQGLFYQAREDAERVASECDNPFIGKNVSKKKLAEMYVAGEDLRVTHWNFREDYIIEDMDVVRYLQGKRADAIYESMRKYDGLFDKWFSALVKKVQEAAHYQKLLEEFQPTEDMQVQRAILAEVKKNHLNSLPVRVILECKREDINESFRAELPDTFVIHGEVIGGWVFQKPFLMGYDFKARAEKKFWKLDDEGHSIPLFTQLPWRKILEAKFVDKQENCIALYFREE